ncbi:MAG: glutamine synthetase, partial [Candidatus Dormibacteraeota bacterium]|nr:glutamine synthetase [Candidatus Dormibacteraeota bacterium]
MAVDEALGVRVTERRPDTAAAWKPAPSPKDVSRDAQEQAVQMVDLRFTDLVGSWQHFSIPVSELSESLFREG